MAHCPHCQAENDADFGLVNCQSCGRPFLIEIDGEARAADFESPPSPEPAPPEPSEQLADFLLDDLSSPASDEPTQHDLRDIATFGNSEASLAKEGAYRFNISISGIDSADMKRDVRDALTDTRFLWDLDDVLSRIEGGTLKLKDMPAVKSAIIIQRLKILPVDIKWEQYAIHQS